jgi:hypothetical protein
LVPATMMRHNPGLAASPPMRNNLEIGEEKYSSPFLFRFRRTIPLQINLHNFSHVLPDTSIDILRFSIEDLKLEGAK